MSRLASIFSGCSGEVGLCGSVEYGAELERGSGPESQGR